jgi:hypothetical protein
MKNCEKKEERKLEIWIRKGVAWFTHQGENGEPIIVPFPQETAPNVLKVFYMKENQVSQQYKPDRSPEGYGAKHLNIWGEMLLASSELFSVLRERYFIESEGLSYEQLCGCDETGFSFKTFPSNIGTYRDVKNYFLSGCKTGTERLLIWPARFR